MKRVMLFLLAFYYGYSNGQVNYQTGAAEQSFPLVNFAEEKSGLSLGVSLGYFSGNGLAVGDIASNVGTGWNLSAGGIIIRMQNGLPDDQEALANGNLTTNPNNLHNYPAGYLYSPYLLPGCNTGLAYFPMFKKSSDPVYKEHNIVAVDTEQDKFLFSFNGRSGTFVVNKLGQVTTIGDSRLKLEVVTADLKSLGIRTRIDKFIITAEDGVKYTFRDKSLSHVCEYRYVDMRSDGTFVVNTSNPGNDYYTLNRFAGIPLDAVHSGVATYPYIVSAWYLSEMENLNNGEKITFEYDNIIVDTYVGKLVARSWDLGSGKRKNQYEDGRKRIDEFLLNPNKARDLSYDLNQLNAFGSKATNVTYIRSKQKTVRLKKINFPGNSYLSFGYSTLGRADLQGESALEKIEYYHFSKLVRAYKLNYGYFYQNQIVPYYYLLERAVPRPRTGGLPFPNVFAKYNPRFFRLCLLSIQKIGNGADEATEPAYKFGYYTGSSAADDIVPPRNSLSTDHWGYYNGNNSGLNNSADHDLLTINDGVSKAGLPSYKNPKDGYAKNGLLKSIQYPTGGTLTYEYSQVKTNTWNQVKSSQQRLGGGVSVSKVTLFDNENHSKDIIKQYAYKEEDGTSSRWGDETGAYYSFNTIDYTLAGGILSGSERRKYVYPGVEYPELAVHIDWAKIRLTSTIIAVVVTAIQVVATILTSSVVGAIIGAVLFVVSSAFAIITNTKFPEYHTYNLTNQNNVLGNPLPMLYARVEVTENAPTGYNGKTIYEFTDYRDFPVTTPEYKWPFVPSQRFINWVYGMPKRTVVLDKNNNMVKEIKNDFEVKRTAINKYSFNCKCVTHKRETLNEDKWRGFEFANYSTTRHKFLSPFYYTYLTGSMNVKSIGEKMFNQSGLYSETKRSISTDPATLLTKNEIEVHEDRNRVVINYYPTDYNIPGAIQRLKQNNAIHVPIASETWDMKVNVSGNVVTGVEQNLLDAKITEYKEFTFTNGVSNYTSVKPWKTYELAQKTPVPIATIGSHQRDVLVRQPQLFRLTNEYVYDNKGNLIQTNSNDNKEAYFYEYDDRYRVATVFNADQPDCAYSSFEGDGSGSWTFNISNRNATSGLTGFGSFKLSQGNITKTGLNAAQTYIITYWMNEPSSGGSITVNGQAGDYQASSGSWHLFRKEITGVTSITIAGNRDIDELRLHPKGALMSTVAYKPGIGKVAECDANNRIAFYEYDALGRLKLIRDHEMNVVKTYEYHYKQQ